MMRRLLFAVIGVFALGGCSGMQIEDFAETKPVFKPEEFFQGHSRAWGMFQDRFGNIRRQFVVDIDGTLQDGVLVLDESFVYADGEHAKRVWQIKPLGNGDYEGTAGDVVGTARGRTVGNAMRWAYDLDLPINGSTWRVHFDDWMLLQDDGVMLNKSTITKFGIELGQVFISFRRLSAKPSGDAGP